MKDISIYFSPVQVVFDRVEGTVGSKVQIHHDNSFPEIEKNGIAILYVPEYRNGKIELQGKENDAFRSFLYEMYVGENWNFNIYDLGTIKPGESVSDTYFAIESAVTELIKKNVLPIVIGGTQDLTFPIFKSFGNLEQMVNICSIDRKLDLGNPDEELNKDAYLTHLMLQRPCYLFNYVNIGAQAPYINKEELVLFDKLYFDVCRLGEFNTDFKIAEPHLRNSDFLTIDLESMRYSDFQGEMYDSPNGFYADQICQLAKYAGISDKLSVLGLFNYYPVNLKNASYSLLAQVIWYFIDGVSLRKGDFPKGSKKDYIKFTVHLDDFKDEVIFYKSNKSERWWMEVPYPMDQQSKYERHHLVPCDFKDYEMAMKNEIPHLWWKTYQKLS